MRPQTLALLAQVQDGARINADQFTQPDDDWIPMLFCLDANDQLALASLTFDNEEEKEHIWRVDIPALIAETKAISVATVLSSWMVARPIGLSEDQDWPGAQAPRPSEHPDRKELVLVTAFDAEGHVATYAEIQRDGVHPPRLGEWQTFQAPNSGRVVEPIVAALHLNAMHLGKG